MVARRFTTMIVISRSSVIPVLLACNFGNLFWFKFFNLAIRLLMWKIRHTFRASQLKVFGVWFFPLLLFFHFQKLTPTTGMTPT